MDAGSDLLGPTAADCADGRARQLDPGSRAPVRGKLRHTGLVAPLVLDGPMTASQRTRRRHPMRPRAARGRPSGVDRHARAHRASTSCARPRLPSYRSTRRCRRSAVPAMPSGSTLLPALGSSSSPPSRTRPSEAAPSMVNEAVPSTAAATAVGIFPAGTLGNQLFPTNPKDEVSYQTSEIQDVPVCHFTAILAGPPR
jgi:hypothetical protein